MLSYLNLNLVNLLLKIILKNKCKGVKIIMERLYQIIANKDLSFIVFTNNNKNYKAEWFFKNNFEKNGFITDLSIQQYREVCSFIDLNFTYLVKSYKKKKTIFTNSQSIDYYLKIN